MVRQLHHSNFLLLGAGGVGGELTGTGRGTGDPQDPRQHKDEKEFVAPKC